MLWNLEAGKQDPMVAAGPLRADLKPRTNERHPSLFSHLWFNSLDHFLGSTWPVWLQTIDNTLSCANHTLVSFLAYHPRN